MAINRSARGSDMRQAMGVDWMTVREARQAIPPAYTEWIGKQLINRMEMERVA